MKGCSTIKFKIAREPIGINDYQFAVFDLDDISEDIYQKYWNTFQTAEHKLLGSPDFTQEDPRSYFLNSQDNSSEAYILLSQINSECIDSIKIMWGDTGIANFFIKGSDLDKLDFSKILYNRDCT